MMGGGLVLGAVYNLPTHLINIPTVESYEKWDMEFGISSGFFNSEHYEFDTKFNIALTNRLMVGLNWVNISNFVGHVHYNFFGDEDSFYGLSGGVTNITSNDTLSSWNDRNVTQNTQVSPYIVFAIRPKIVHFYVGYGGNRFRYAEKSFALMEGLDGFFFGTRIPLYRAFIEAEFDGKDFNTGLTYPVNDRTTIYIALTEIGNSGSRNPQYSNTPVRSFSFGAVHRFNFLKIESPEKETLKTLIRDTNKVKEDVEDLKQLYENELEKLQLERDSLSEEVRRLKSSVQEDIRYIDKDVSEIKNEHRDMYLSINQDISEEVLRYYYLSFELYSQKEHYKAIAILQKAIALNPYLPQLYVRLGSIYFDLKLKDVAATQWSKALELDPKNLKLKRLIERLK